MLQRQPQRYRFDAALRVLAHVARTDDPAAAARFRSQPGQAFPTAEVSAVEPPQAGRPDGSPTRGRAGSPARVTVPLMGLPGAAGALPRLYDEAVLTTLRNRSAALHDFLDLLSHRMVAAFGRAGGKYRLHRAAEAAGLASPPRADPVARALLAFSGYALPGLVERLAAGAEPLRHYAGLFAAHPRSAERLAALLSDWLGRTVEVQQFAGSWLALPPEQRTRLPRRLDPGAFNRLGVDAAIGVRCWDVQARVVLRIGPLDRAAFAALLPDAPGHARLASLARAFLGWETAFAINPVLAAGEVPQLRLDGRARLGWNSWLEPPPGAPTKRRADAGEASFEPLPEEQGA